MFNPFSFFWRKPTVPAKPEPRRNMQANTRSGTSSYVDRSDRSSNDHVSMAGLGFGAGVLPGSTESYSRHTSSTGHHNSPGGESGGWSAQTGGCGGGDSGGGGSGDSGGGSCGGSD